MLPQTGCRRQPRGFSIQRNTSGRGHGLDSRSRHSYFGGGGLHEHSVDFGAREEIRGGKNSSGEFSHDVPHDHRGFGT